MPYIKIELHIEAPDVADWIRDQKTAKSLTWNDVTKAGCCDMAAYTLMLKSGARQTLCRQTLQVFEELVGETYPTPARIGEMIAYAYCNMHSDRDAVIELFKEIYETISQGECVEEHYLENLILKRVYAFTKDIADITDRYGSIAAERVLASSSG